ncbi:DUF1292 domain-containing protein [Paenibacillus sp. L3-i20]|uniref:DUF1292 domain-containing protein n=1 Tax=Paenibacillus sp. L3-i20 TaxID=2905833 RepID=UPI001EE0D8BD|nr:DUF1292 domain-containing protein [Paenibacillus sp. L3-i20]GKU75632.1 hypothetical protein L3i20_v200290 [Paenibacillus sp. L3-i20]
MSESSNIPKRQSHLKEAFGNDVELISEEGVTELFSIKDEFQIGDVLYAALQNEAMRGEDEVELFRVILGGSEPQLETIEDDEEWEAASEAYDDLLFANDERP